MGLRCKGTTKRNGTVYVRRILRRAEINLRAQFLTVTIKKKPVSRLIQANIPAATEVQSAGCIEFGARLNNHSIAIKHFSVHDSPKRHRVASFRRRASDTIRNYFPKRFPMRFPVAVKKARRRESPPLEFVKAFTKKAACNPRSK